MWPMLKEKVYTKLLKLSSPIKYPLACSVHEIAKIIGSAKAKKDLFPVMNQLLLLDNSSKDAKVKRGAIKNMAKFYQALDETTREEFVDVFLQVQTENKYNWRIREVIAGQMDVLSSIFTPETTFRVIMPICFQMCRDTVSIVRRKAGYAVYNLF